MQTCTAIVQAQPDLFHAVYSHQAKVKARQLHLAYSVGTLPFMQFENKAPTTTLTLRGQPADPSLDALGDYIPASQQTVTTVHQTTRTTYVEV